MDFNKSNFKFDQYNFLQQNNKAEEQDPIPRPIRDRESSLLNFSNNPNLPANNHGFISSIGYPIKDCSKKSISELKPITLKEMMVPKVHFNSYILCRTISETSTSIETTVLIEDVNGDVEELMLYNFRKLNETVDDFLPIGTIMIIKEPYLKFTLSGKVSIRCDSPSDVIFLDETDEILKDHGWMVASTETYENLKSKANDFYNSKDYENAIKYYNRALKIENNKTIYLNRSAAYMQLNQYYDAYNDAKLAFEMDANREKSLFRMGKAAYGMRNWHKAKKHFEDLIKEFPNNKDAVNELHRTEKRIEEANGKYDVNVLYEQAYTKNVVFMDIADYVGPVKISDIKDKGGKGLFASEDIKKGTLLLVSKAFSFTNSVTVLTTALVNNKMCIGSQALNFGETIHYLKKNPHRSKELYSLYAGDLERDTNIPDGVIDTERIEKICSFNEFQADLINGSNKASSSTDTPTGLWILPSFINHSCISNAYRSFYGDVMVVYAMKDLKKDDEITFSYVDPLKPYTERLQMMKHYMFVCECELCLLDRSDKFYEERINMHKQEYKAIQSLILKNPQRALTLTIDYIARLRETYKNRDKYQFRLFFPLDMLGNIYIALGQLEKAAATFNEVITIYDEFTEFAMSSLISAVACYGKSGNYDYGKQLLRKGVQVIRIKLGGDKKLFKIIHSEMLKKCNLYDIF